MKHCDYYCRFYSNIILESTCNCKLSRALMKRYNKSKNIWIMLIVLRDYITAGTVFKFGKKICSWIHAATCKNVTRKFLQRKLISVWCKYWSISSFVLHELQVGTQTPTVRDRPHTTPWRKNTKPALHILKTVCILKFVVIPMKKIRIEGCCSMGYIKPSTAINLHQQSIMIYYDTASALNINWTSVHFCCVMVKSTGVLRLFK